MKVPVCCVCVYNVYNIHIWWMYYIYLDILYIIFCVLWNMQRYLVCIFLIPLSVVLLWILLFLLCVYHCLKHFFMFLYAYLFNLLLLITALIFHRMHFPLICFSSDASSYSYKQCSRGYIKWVPLWNCIWISLAIYTQELYSWVIELALPMKA